MHGQRQWRKIKGEKTDTTKVMILFAWITNVYVNVRGGCMWSSARMGYVDSWCGRVVDVRSWTFDESSWRRSSRGDTARCLMLVGSLNEAGWSLRAAEVGRVVESSWMVVAGSWDRSGRWMQLDGRCGQLRSVGRSVVGKSMSRFWHFVGMVELWLLARNSESLRGLVVAMLGQSVTASRYVDCIAGAS